nr:RNA-guided endonuclease IscB [Okeania sp. KiyG1]
MNFRKTAVIVLTDGELEGQKNLRYRKPGNPNKKKPTGWLAPSLIHRVETTMTWVKRLIKFSPVESISMELVRFDTQLIQNPEIKGIEYQQGELAGYELREYLLEKWGPRCASTSGKTNTPLEIEHIHPKSKGGSDRVSNLTVACTKCNQIKSNQDVKDFLSGKPELLKRILTQAKSPLKDALLS